MNERSQVPTAFPLHNTPSEETVLGQPTDILDVLFGTAADGAADSGSVGGVLGRKEPMIPTEWVGKEDDLRYMLLFSAVELVRTDALENLTDF